MPGICEYDLSKGSCKCLNRVVQLLQPESTKLFFCSHNQFWNTVWKARECKHRCVWIREKTRNKDFCGIGPVSTSLYWQKWRNKCHILESVKCLILRKNAEVGHPWFMPLSLCSCWTTNLLLNSTYVNESHELNFYSFPSLFPGLQNP